MSNAPAGSCGVQFRDAPPTVKALRCEVLRPAPNKPVSGIIVCPFHVGVILHFIGEQSHLCRKNCPYCDLPFPHARWKGYYGCQGIKSGKLFIIELTEEAGRKGSPLLTDKSGQLRGKILTATRIGKSMNGPVKARLEQPVPAIPENDMQDPWDLVSSVLAFHGAIDNSAPRKADQHLKRRARGPQGVSE